MMVFQRDTTAAARGERVTGLVKPSSLVQDAGWGDSWGIFLDEFDKTSGSEFIRLQLFDLVNTIYETKSQLCLSTNFTKYEFSKFFGDHIAWRIFNHCHWIELGRDAQNPVAA